MRSADFFVCDRVDRYYISHELCGENADQTVSLTPPSGWLPDIVPRFPQPGWQVVGDTAVVELGGVWICVWMDLMCKHWASVIWWHIKGGLPVGLPTRRLYADNPPGPPNCTHTHWHQIYVFMHCSGTAQRMGLGKEAVWSADRQGCSGGWWSIGVRIDWRMGGRGDIWRAMMLIHKFK